MKALDYLIYVSAATSLMNNDELDELLRVSRSNNLVKNITGMLLYSEGSFIQVLEGSAEDVEATFETIKQDTRHKNVTTVLTGEVDERNFPDWTMGYLTVKKYTMRKLEGYLDPMSDDFLASDSSHPAINVLKTFADSNKRYFKV